MFTLDSKKEIPMKQISSGAMLQENANAHLWFQKSSIVKFKLNLNSVCPKNLLYVYRPEYIYF